jgi:hypothetical protein
MEITNLAVKDWLDEIEHSKKREKDFHKDGEDIIDIYNGENPLEIPFNILYSNTETLVPALYSQTPKPVVKRRFNQDEDPVVMAVEKAGTRILEYLLDTNVDGYEKFDDSMHDAVLDAVLPGRGVTQIKFDADMDDESVKWAFVCGDSRKWDRVHFGYAKKWAQIPWVAFEEYLDEGECEELFGKEVVKEINFSENEDDDETDDTGEKSPNKTAIIYQIWDKAEKVVKWITPQYDGYLLEQDDPLGVNGFFPMPKPLMLHRKSNDMMPTALYTMYKNQATELNRITTRLNKVIEAIKVRGVYDGALGDELGNILDSDDNELSPTEKGASLIEGGFDKAIWLMPLQELVGVAQVLFNAREQCKSVIYEITGLSDVIRGQSKASETLGAQKIKESWGTMRLKNMQKQVQHYVRDSLRIMLDIASQKIPLRFWGDMTGLPYQTDKEREEIRSKIRELEKVIQKQVQNQQMLQQQQAENAQLKGQPPQPQPPQPPQQVPPELLRLANEPTWEEILEILQDDFTRSYKIDIETNSTLDVEATEDKEQVGEFMNALAQFMNGVQPMVENGTIPFGAMKSMLLEVTRRFRFGIDVEEQIKAMKEPQKPDVAAQMEQIKQQQQEMQKKAQEMQQKEAQLKELEQTIETNKQQAGADLDQKNMKLEVDKIKFESDKKLFEETQKLKQEAAESQLAAGADKFKAEMESINDKQQRNLQSMLDKHEARMSHGANVES